MRKKKKLKIKDIIDDGMIVDLRTMHEVNRYNNIWLGSFKYLSGEVISLDGDDYSLDTVIEKYEIDKDQNTMICWVKAEVQSLNDFDARIEFFNRNRDKFED